MPDRGGGREALIALSAALATRDEALTYSALRRAADESSRAEVEEIILQSHLFVGFPTALRAIALWRAMVGAAPAAAEGEGDALWRERGARVCETVYGSAYARLRERVAGLHPDLDRWMVEGGYGRVLGRPGLDLATRELCIVALLVVWDAPEQLHSHLRGALHAGATLDDTERAVELASAFAAPGATATARELLDRVRVRLGSSAASRRSSIDDRPTTDD